MTAVGVASPTAQGQAMTRVAMPKFSAKMKWLLSFETQLPGKLSVRPAVRGLSCSACSLPLIAVKHMLRQMAAGQLAAIWIDDVICVRRFR